MKEFAPPGKKHCGLAFSLGTNSNGTNNVRSENSINISLLWKYLISRSLIFLLDITWYICSECFPVLNLMLGMPGKKFCRKYFEIFFLFFPENRLWHFMQIDNLHEMSMPISEKNKKNIIHFLFAEFPKECCVKSLQLQCSGSTQSWRLQHQESSVFWLADSFHYLHEQQTEIRNYWNKLWEEMNTHLAQEGYGWYASDKKSIQLNIFFISPEICVLWILIRSTWPMHFLTLVQQNPDIPCLCKQCRSRSVGFWRSQLIWICTVCH